jgi:hypothetical protein
LIALGLAGGLFGAGYLLRPSSDAAAKGIPPAIVQQVSYNLYFPAPMPHGYSYMKDTATFQIGQVFYKFSNGKKRVTVKEEPMPDPKPDLNLLAGYDQIDVPIGHAAIGTSLGEPNAVVLAGTTVITFNGSGGVTTDELKTAINNLKLIGKNTDKKS